MELLNQFLLSNLFAKKIAKNKNTIPNNVIKVFRKL